MASILAVFRRHPEIELVKFYGSRAKGNARPESDIDLALFGAADRLDERAAESIAEELDELPLPLRFDVRTYDAIRNPALKEHIDRVGIIIFGNESNQVAESGPDGYMRIT
jgi:predicted nucleotidyltransferase